MERRESEAPAKVELGVGGGGYCKDLAAGSGGPVWAYDTFDSRFPLHTATDGENVDILGEIALPCHGGIKKELEALGVICVVGEFPATFYVSHPISVSFVHVDMDTYISTLYALLLFHPLMIDGGVFMIHDYDNHGLPGVKRAADEFEAGPFGAQYEYSEEAGHHKMRKRPYQTPLK